ncbi:MAG: EAL domain-containing protein [Lachnospiraceae bacterium]|nr:EAL domain-containing protein [Lachnospiraceae bacterium]
MEMRFDPILNYKRTVLIVDDEEVNRLLLGSILEDDYNIIYAENGREAWNVISEKTSTISIVLLDLMMPEMNGFEVIKMMQRNVNTAAIPVIVLTSEKAMEVESLRLGAADFISKPYDMPEIILARVNRMVQFFEDKQVISSVERDELTGIYTKRFFFKYCEKLDKFHPDVKTDAIMVDVDHYGLLKELYGNDMAEGVLRICAKTLYLYAGKHDGIAGRGEDDTFYAYLMATGDHTELAAELNKRVAEEFPDTNIHIRVGVFKRESRDVSLLNSFHYAQIAGDTISGDYSALIAVYDNELRNATLFKDLLIHDIKAGIETGQFVVYYQPKYAIQGDRPRLCGAEALVRWFHKDFGFLTPDKYISLFEQNGLIQLVDRFVWKETAEQIKKWKDRYDLDLPVSVNASRMDLFDPKLSDVLLEITKAAGISPQDLHVEVTESAYSKDQDRMIEAVKKIRDNGFAIEMDDFGTGYSALNILCSIPLDVLKLDMSFVRQMESSHENEMMVDIILDMAKMLGVEVNAEGVETGVQLDKLKKLGCDMVQGFYFSKPVPPAEFEKFMEKEIREKGE